MATTAASQAAPPAPPPSGGRGSAEQAYELVRARQRRMWQLVWHVLFVAGGLFIGWYIARPDAVVPTMLRGLGLGFVLGLLFAWLIPWLVQDKKTAPYVFVSPFFILFLTFGVFPILFSLYLSFQRWDPTTGLAGMSFAGWERFDAGWISWLPIPGNYHYAATDRNFGKAAWNTLFIAVASGVPQHIIGMPLAYFFHTSYKRFRNLITGAWFLPFITSSVAISLIFSSLFSQHFGVLNAALDALAQIPGLGWIPHGQEGHINWLGRAPNVKPAISFVVWWRYVGWNTVLYLSALQAISNELFEAAEMDGATRWQTFSRVVLPLLRPMMLFAVTLTIIGNFQLFEEPFIITGTAAGGVEYSGMTAAMFMYRYMIEYPDEYGTACAISWMLFIVIALLTWLNQLVFSRYREAEGVS
jgi:multiple sugar transport system permease protein